MRHAGADTPWLHLVLAFNAAVFALHFWLSCRQRKALRIAAPPPAVAHLYSQDEFERKRAYNVAKLRFSQAHMAWDWVLTAVLLLAGFLPATWRLAGVLAPGGGELTRSVVWALLQAGAALPLGLPWSAWSTFVVEARHGFNQTTPRTFALDALKSALLGALLLPPVVAGLTGILQRAGPWMGLQLWAFLLALALFAVSVYPTLVAPLFNTFQPLPPGPLRESIEALAASLAFPLRKLFVVDGSRRSAHSNAYMYGFGRNKRIVLYDTLLKQCDEKQVVAVLAHELGHWKLRHMPKLLAATQALTLAQFLLLTLIRTAPGLFESFGFAPGDRPALASLLLFSYLIGPVDELLGWGSNVVSRRFEYQADAFAVGLGHAQPLRDALCALDKENKGAVNVDPLYSSFHHSHPPLLERLAAIDAGLKKKGE